MIERKPLIYVAGPYTRPDPVENTHRAIKFAAALCDLDYIHHPFVPHLTLLWHMVTPRPLEYWYEFDMHMLSVCETIVRLPGESTGADAEMEQAERWGIKEVSFYDMPWIARREWTGG